MRRLLALISAGGLAVLVTLTLVPPAGADAAREPDRVKLVIAVDGCEACTVGLTRGDEWGWTAKGVRGDGVVSDGEVVFTLPHRQTKGLVVTVQDPDAVRTNAVPIAIIRYRGQAADETIGDSRATHARAARLCAAEVPGDVAQWSLRVAHVPGTDFVTGDPGYDIRPYFTPGVASFADLTKLARRDRGGVQVNGDFFCHAHG